MACLFAAAPTSLYPYLVKATTEGVVLEPYAFSMTLGVLPSIKATQELVVPRSIPMIAPVLAVEKDLIRHLSKNVESMFVDNINLFIVQIKYNFISDVEMI
jgi:hypothetical protein